MNLMSQHLLLTNLQSKNKCLLSKSQFKCSVPKLTLLVKTLNSKPNLNHSKHTNVRNHNHLLLVLSLLHNKIKQPNLKNSLKHHNQELNPKHHNQEHSPKHHNLEHSLKHHNLERNLKHRSQEVSQERLHLVLGPLQQLRYNKRPVEEHQLRLLVLLQEVQEHLRLQDLHHQPESLLQPLHFRLISLLLKVLKVNQCWI